jgi:hypothetical protein
MRQRTATIEPANLLILRLAVRTLRRNGVIVALEAFNH